MSWRLSRFRTGDLVEVRSKEEILATLDVEGCLDGMPLMPEMLRFCGQRLRVAAVAHKTCEVARKTWKGRRLETMVHLEQARCDGSAHGGCQADCSLFWKDAWLKPVSAGGTAPSGALAGRGISESDLMAQTRRPVGATNPDALYSCQATRMFEATAPLSWWNPRQYLRDVTTGNHSLGHAMQVLLLAWLRALHANAPRGTYRLTKALYSGTHRWIYGRPLPAFTGRIPAGQPTPTERLALMPGDLVRIKSREEIERTLDTNGQNRGLFCDQEGAPYCGTVATVRRTITQFVDESTGELRRPKQPCVMLEEVYCKALYSDSRLLCPRAIRSWWREVWLERVSPAPGSQQ